MEKWRERRSSLETGEFLDGARSSNVGTDLGCGSVMRVREKCDEKLRGGVVLGSVECRSRKSAREVPCTQVSVQRTDANLGHQAFKSRRITSREQRGRFDPSPPQLIDWRTLRRNLPNATRACSQTFPEATLHHYSGKAFLGGRTRVPFH